MRGNKTASIRRHNFAKLSRNRSFSVNQSYLGIEGDSVNGTEVAFHESMRINNAKANTLSASAEFRVAAAHNTIFWRPRCTDSPFPCWRLLRCA
jgi:hypothetical protein